MAKPGNKSKFGGDVKQTPDRYTDEWVIAEVKGLLTTLRGDDGIIYLGQLFEDKDYSRQRFSEWAEKENKEISDTIIRIREILESRAVAGAMRKDLDGNFTKFHLVNNYGWKDRVEQSVDNRISGSLNMDELPDDNLLKKAQGLFSKKKK